MIDNHSTDGTDEWLRSTPYKFLVNEENKGFPVACNQGMAMAEADFDIFLLNNDTLMMPNTLILRAVAL